MPRYIEINPSKILRGDIHTRTGNHVEWTANSDAEKLEDGRVVVSVTYPTPSTLKRQTEGTAEWANDVGLVRILRRRPV